MSMSLPQNATPLLPCRRRKFRKDNFNNKDISTIEQVQLIAMN